MTTTERYGLSRSSRKYTCPACGKKSFTYYVDRGYNPANPQDALLGLQMVGGEYILGTEYGWCDHENSCAYHRTPKDFFMDRRINGNAYQKAYTPPVEQPKVIIPIDARFVSQSMFYSNGQLRTDSTLLQYIINLPIDTDNIRVLADVIVWYRIGVCKALVNEWDGKLGKYVTSEGNGTIFWMIDAEGRVRAGKQMWFHSDGHRDHDCRPRSVKYKLIERGLLPKGYEVAQCLYGEHLLNEPHFDGKPVFVVESEKTAFLCAMLRPDYLWMACSSKGCANEQHLQPLKDRGRKIILMPDLDGYWTDEHEQQLLKEHDEQKRRVLQQRKNNAWNLRERQLSQWYDKIGVSYYVLDHAKPEDGPTADIGDIILREMVEYGQAHPEVLDKMPEPIDTADIQPEQPTVDYGIPMTEPLKLLIERFDLVPV